MNLPAPRSQPPVQMRVVNLVPAALITIAALLLINFFSHVVSSLMAVVLAVLIATALNPVVRFLSRWLPRGLAAALTVLGAAVLLVGSVLMALPPVIAQVQGLVAMLPTNIDQLQGQLAQLQERYPQFAPFLSVNNDALQQIDAWVSAQLARTAGSLLGWIMELGVGLFMALVTLVMIIYTLASPTPLINGVIGAVPQGFRVKATRTLAAILMQMGAWGRATALLMLMIGGTMAAGLYFLGVENWLIFGLLAAIGELIPNVGSIVATAIPVLFVIATDPQVALYVVLLSIGLHLVEAYLVAPLLMSGAAKMHPLSVMVGILLFGNVFGLVGAFLTVPFLIVIKAVYENFVLTEQPGISQEVAQALIDGDVEAELVREQEAEEARSEAQEPPPTKATESVSLSDLEELLDDVPAAERGATETRS